MPSPEICNGLDDDCDGMIDEDDQGLPLDCPNCVPTPEVCDGVDNDCDLAIDEQGDVEVNQPDVFGIPCQEPVAPNDQPPCQAGTVLCINAMPVCVGAIGPKMEICNGLDDDCDGIADDLAPCPDGTQCVMGGCFAPCGTGEFPCPQGYQCDAGFCFPVTCDDVACDPGQVCQNGICVDATGGGGQGGGAAQGGGAQGGGTSQGGGSANGGAGPGGSGDGGVNNDDTWGLATGGGGCGVSRTPSLGWGLLAAVIAMLGLARRRSGK